MSDIQYVVIVAIIVTVFYMSSVLKKTSADSPLTFVEKLVIIITTIFNPIIAGAIYYYGWSKKLPTKAKQANTISFVVVFIGLISFIAYMLFSSGVI